MSPAQPQRAVDKAGDRGRMVHMAQQLAARSWLGAVDTGIAQWRNVTAAAAAEKEVVGPAGRNIVEPHASRQPGADSGAGGEERSDSVGGEERSGPAEPSLKASLALEQQFLEDVLADAVPLQPNGADDDGVAGHVTAGADLRAYLGKSRGSRRPAQYQGALLSQIFPGTCFCDGVEMQVELRCRRGLDAVRAEIGQRLRLAGMDFGIHVRDVVARGGQQADVTVFWVRVMRTPMQSGGTGGDAACERFLDGIAAMAQRANDYVTRRGERGPLVVTKLDLASDHRMAFSLDAHRGLEQRTQLKDLLALMCPRLAAKRPWLAALARPKILVGDNQLSTAVQFVLTSGTLGKASPAIRLKAYAKDVDLLCKKDMRTAFGTNVATLLCAAHDESYNATVWAAKDAGLTRIELSYYFGGGDGLIPPFQAFLRQAKPGFLACHAEMEGVFRAGLNLVHPAVVARRPISALVAPLAALRECWLLVGGLEAILVLAASNHARHFIAASRNVNVQKHTDAHVAGELQSLVQKHAPRGARVFVVPLRREQRPFPADRDRGDFRLLDKDRRGPFCLPGLQRRPLVPATWYVHPTADEVTAVAEPSMLTAVGIIREELGAYYTAATLP